MMPLRMPDSEDPVTTTSGSAATRRGRPGAQPLVSGDRFNACGLHKNSNMDGWKHDFRPKYFLLILGLIVRHEL